MYKDVSDMISFVFQIFLLFLAMYYRLILEQAITFTGYLSFSAASTSNILDGDKEPAKEKHTPLTKYGEQKQIVVDGKGKLAF